MAMKPTTREDVDATIYNWLVAVHGEDKALDLTYEIVSEALDDLEQAC